MKVTFETQGVSSIEEMPLENALTIQQGDILMMPDGKLHSVFRRKLKMGYFGDVKAPQMMVKEVTLVLRPE